MITFTVFTIIGPIATYLQPCWPESILLFKEMILQFWNDCETIKCLHLSYLQDNKFKALINTLVVIAL